MPKNKQGGKKYKQQKHKENDDSQRALLKPTEEQEFAYVTKLLGNSRVSARFYDKRDKENIRINEIICFLRPELKKKRQFAKIGSLMIIALRDFEKNKADVIHIYNDEEVKRAKRKKLFNEDIILEEDIGEGFKFVDNDDEFEDSEDENEKKSVEEKPKVRGNNISFQDFGIPDDESDVEIENI